MTDQPPSAAAPSRVRFWQGLLSGKDNQTPAIGRVLAAVVILNLAIVLPGVAVGWMLHQAGLSMDDWKGLFLTLTAYVPAILAASTGLVRLTAPTEPGAS